jgi:hypothetical protein
VCAGHLHPLWIATRAIGMMTALRQLQIVQMRRHHVASCVGAQWNNAQVVNNEGALFLFAFPLSTEPTVAYHSPASLLVL